ncbi:MAG: hypothetical protein AAFZ07_03930 [Actinomycetota bacterium]
MDVDLLEHSLVDLTPDLVGDLCVQITRMCQEREGVVKECGGLAEIGLDGVHLVADLRSPGLDVMEAGADLVGERRAVSDEVEEVGLSDVESVELLLELRPLEADTLVGVGERVMNAAT